MKTHTLPLIATLAASLAASAHAGPSGFTPLGFLRPNHGLSTSAGISADGGTVTGTSSIGSGSDSTPYLWTSSGGMVAVPKAPMGIPGAFATAISGDGTSVIGFSVNLHVTPFYSSPTRANTSIPLPPDDSSISYLVSGISGDGSVVVGNGRSAFRWVSGAGSVALPPVPGESSTVARGVSGDGNIVVGSSGNFAMRWTAGGGSAALPTPAGASSAGASAISLDGATVVGSASFGTFSRAIRWTGAGPTDLGFLSGGSSASATGVSPDGSLIIGTATVGDVNEPFLWDAGRGMRDVRSFLEESGLGDEIAGWRLTGVSGVTVDAQGLAVLTGTGVDPQGRTQAYVARAPVPEPASLAALGFGALALLRKRRGGHARSPDERP